MTTKAIIRRATIEDTVDIVAHVHGCYRGDASKVGWTTEADLVDGPRTDRAEVERLISTPGSMILLYTDNGSIVGSVNIQEQGAECYLGMLAVRPGAQGSGIGRRLMQAAENVARNTWDSKNMTMTVISVRSELMAYYERRGYHRTGKMKPFIADEVHGTPRIEGMQFEVMEKNLENRPGRSDGVDSL